MFEMSLFDTGDIKKDIKTFKVDLRDYALRLGIELPKSFTVTFGSPDSVDKNIMVISEPITSEWFKSKEIYRLKCFLPTITEHFFITSCYLIPKERVSVGDIKNFSGWISRLAALIRPKLIVILNENAEHAFIKRKMILEENHGKEITIWNNTPIYLTYPMSYYYDKSEYEDVSYKDFIRDNDWTNIKNRYNKLMNKDT